MSTWRRFSFIFLPIALGACHVELPSYWLCKGVSSQQLNAQDSRHEQYSGAGLLMLEIYQGRILQYISKPFTGNYAICSHAANQIQFELGECEKAVDSGLQNRRGVLDKTSGVLLMTEVTGFQNKVISNRGEYACRYLGNQYPASVFYIDDDN